MEFSAEVTINKPLEDVLKLFDDLDHLKSWMPGFVSFTTISGTQGEVGAKAKLVYNMNGRMFEMIETITVKNLPHEFTGTYDINGMTQSISNSFDAVDATTTKMTSTHSVEFKGFMKLMSLFIGGAIKKQTRQNLERFKQFAETGKPVKS